MFDYSTEQHRWLMTWWGKIYTVREYTHTQHTYTIWIKEFCTFGDFIKLLVSNKCETCHYMMLLAVYLTDANIKPFGCFWLIFMSASQ